VAPPGSRPVAARRGAARLSADDLVMVERFLDRRNDVPDHVRRQTATALAARVRRQLNVPADDATADEALLEEVATEARSGWR
jgi:hypothetical protein